MADKEKSFQELIQSGNEFWQEASKSSVCHTLEMAYKPEIIRDYGISDFIVNDKNVLIKWYKRIIPLSDEELLSRGFRVFSRAKKVKEV